MSARCVQCLQECPRVLELRLEVGCCAHRSASFPCFNMLYFAHHDGYRQLIWFWWECYFNSPMQSSCSVTRNVRLKYTQKEAGGNCRGRSSSLSEIMQIVTSAVRVLWPAKVTLVVDLTCLLYKPRQLCHQARPGGRIHRSVMQGLKPAKKCASSWRRAHSQAVWPLSARQTSSVVMSAQN